MAAPTITDPILVVSDLHGHLGLLRQALAEGLRLAGPALADAGRDRLPTVLMGDYLDNGPEIVDLVEYLSSGAIHDEFPTLEVHGIMGNHDLAGILAYDPTVFGAVDPETVNGEPWWPRWCRHWNRGGSTPAQYIGCPERRETLAAYRAAMDARPAHMPWLRARSLYLQLAGYVFVHAGLRPGEALESQLALLSRPDPLSPEALRGTTHKRDARYPIGYGMPDQIVSKDWPTANDPAWGQVVVTGHYKHHDGQDFVASHRLALHSGACELSFRPQGGLHCALLQANPGSLATCPPLCFQVR